MSRKEERQEAFKVLYAREVNGSYDSKVESEFTERLVDETRRREEEIDELLEANLDEWRLTRIYPVERVLLRLGVFELLYTDTEKPVVINEAVELAKKFGAEDSASFVNGILDNFETGEKVS